MKEEDKQNKKNNNWFDISHSLEEKFDLTVIFIFFFVVVCLLPRKRNTIYMYIVHFFFIYSFGGSTSNK